MVCAKWFSFPGFYVCEIIQISLFARPRHGMCHRIGSIGEGVIFQLQALRGGIGIRRRRTDLKFLVGVLSGVARQIFFVLIHSLYIVVAKHTSFVRIAPDKDGEMGLSALPKDSSWLLQ